MQQYLEAVKHSAGNNDIRRALDDQRRKARTALQTTSGPRLVHQSTKTFKTIDTEDKEEKSALDADGKIITETKRVTEHEEVKDVPVDDENAADIDITQESSQRHHKTKGIHFSI